MTDLITLSSGALTACINPLGAELWSLVDANGAEYMTDADPAFWSGHAPLLFPIVGALAQDTLVVNGTDYTLPRHGFARRSMFDVLVAEDDFAVFGLSDSAATLAVYPFAFKLTMAFRLAGNTLHMVATVTNPGAQPLPFSFGYHPAFAWPLPGGAAKGAHKLVFAEQEPQPIRRVSRDNGLLLDAVEPSPVQGRELTLAQSLFDADAVIWTGLNSRALSYGAEGGAWLDLAFPEMPDLGLWQVPGASYICIEPWAGHADPEYFAREFYEKPGVIALAAGASRRFALDVTVRAA